jgi:hydrogenase/urease accessory protein HupE
VRPAVLLALLSAAVFLRHVGTASYPEITVLEKTVVFDVRADVLLYADYLDFGVPRGGSLTPAALLSRKDDVGSLAARSIHVGLNGADAPLAVESVDLMPAERAGPGRFRVRLAARSSDPIRELRVDYALFREHDPSHRGYARIRHGADEISYVFARGIAFRWQAQDDGSFAPPRARAWLGFLLDGIEHILSGLDHILFLFGLVIAARSASLVAKTVTGFTLAHSLTLGLGAAGVVHLPRAPVEIAIAASIAWVGAANLIARGTGDRRSGGGRWPVAIFFGLVHGLGFSEVLSGLQMPPAEFAGALALFNCGVEAGQLMLLLLVLPPLAWLRERVPLAHRRIVVLGGSAAITLTGLAWALWRACESL